MSVPYSTSMGEYFHNKNSFRGGCKVECIGKGEIVDVFYLHVLKIFYGKTVLKLMFNCSQRLDSAGFHVCVLFVTKGNAMKTSRFTGQVYYQISLEVYTTIKHQKHIGYQIFNSFSITKHELFTYSLPRYIHQRTVITFSSEV